MDDDQSAEAVQEANTAYGAMRAMAHLTRATHPVPDVYGILGNIKTSAASCPKFPNSSPKAW